MYHVQNEDHVSYLLSIRGFLVDDSALYKFTFIIIIIIINTVLLLLIHLSLYNYVAYTYGLADPETWKGDKK